MLALKSHGLISNRLINYAISY